MLNWIIIIIPDKFVNKTASKQNKLNHGNINFGGTTPSPPNSITSYNKFVGK